MTFSIPPISQMSVDSDLTYFKNHLVVSRFRGDVYQIGHFTHFCLHHLFKGKQFQAEMESQGYGNLDDIQIKLYQKIKAYQVKFFKNSIEPSDFWNENENETKNADMHIGKFFEGWLSLQENSGGTSIMIYLLTNTGLHESFLAFLEPTHQNREKPQLKFKESFIDEKESISHTQCIKAHLKKVPKNFLENTNVASRNLSTKIWEQLYKVGVFNDEHSPTKKIVEAVENDNFGLCEKAFSELCHDVRNAHGSLKLQNIKDELLKIKNNYELHQANEFEEIGLFEHLFQQACLYLNNKKTHALFFEKDMPAKKDEFKKFLRAFRFNVNRESLEDLQKRIQDLLRSKFSTSSPLLYAHIYFEIQSWFTQPRPFIKKEGEKTPIIDSTWMRHTIERADICRQAIEKLLEYSLRQFDKVQTKIYGLQIERTGLLEKIDQKVIPAGFLSITGPKGIGKSALIKMYLERQHCPWFAFRGKDLSPHTSLEAFLTYHGLTLNNQMLERFDQEDKKILYIDAIEEVSKKTGAFLDLIYLFRKKNWTIFLSSNQNHADWLRENIEGLSDREIQKLEVPLLDDEEQGVESDSQPTLSNQNDPLRLFLDKYPILYHICWDRLFQPHYIDLFRHPLYLKFFCEEMEKLEGPTEYFNCSEILTNFEQKIWKKVIRHEDSEGVIPELRQRLMIDIVIAQVLQHPTAILRTNDSKTLEAISLLKRDQLLNDKGRLTNRVFIELSLKMYFQEIVEDWLSGNELNNLSDDKLGKIDNFDLIFSDFLRTWLYDKIEMNIVSLVEFLKEEHLNFEAFTACFFQCLLKMRKMQEVRQMLSALPDLANLPVFMGGSRVCFPINIAIGTLDINLIQLLLDHGAKLHSPPENSVISQQKDKRPRDLINPIYRGKPYFCLIPLREALWASRDSNAEKRKELFSFLIEKGAKFGDPVDSYHSQISLLHIAVADNDLESVSFILDEGMDPEVCSFFYNQTPLGQALENILFFSKKAIEDRDFESASKRARDIFVELVNKGAKNTSIMDQEALPHLVRERHYSLAKFLLEKGFDPEDKDQKEINTFQYAYWNFSNHHQDEDEEFCRLLINNYPSFFEND
jgi:hypothetical protein